VVSRDKSMRVDSNFLKFATSINSMRIHVPPTADVPISCSSQRNLAGYRVGSIGLRGETRTPTRRQTAASTFSRNSTDSA
jgi:hypothetical protein